MAKTIKELRQGRWDNDSWYWWLRSKQIYRVLITGKQGAAATVFGIFSLLVTIVLYFLSSGNVPFTKLQLMAGASLILIASAIFGGIWALHTMSPMNYAQTTIGDSTESETLQFISLDIRRACRSFEKKASALARHDPPKRQVLRKPLGKLKKQSAKEHSALLKIAALSELASQQLDIPLYRLRDLLLEYDPAVHRVHARNFIQNLELFISGANLSDEHKNSLRKDNAGIIQRASFRVRAQTEMLEYTALHSSILRMAAVHSTAQATQEYARAISKVADLTWTHSPSEAQPWDLQSEHVLADGMAALRFLACRQRTHLGFDLNQTCLNITKLALRKNKTENLNRQSQALDQLGKSINKEDGGIFNGQRCFFGKDCIEPWKLIGDLRDLWRFTVECIQRDREEIVASFGRMYCGWKKNHSRIRKTLLVTHGFSTTVREVLKRSLQACDPSKKANQQDVPDIFVIGSGDTEDLDSRLMVSALLETPANERSFSRIAAGDKKTLAKLVETDMKVMVILGAECFDRKGRVIHPFGLEDVDIIKDKLGDPGAFSVAVVAEGYKFHEDLLANPQSFRYHLDRIQLYEPHLIDVIITTDVVSANGEHHPRSGTSRGGDRDKHILRRVCDTDRNTIANEFALKLDA